MVTISEFNDLEFHYQDDLAMTFLVEQYVDDDHSVCTDPFDIVAALEESLGYPLALS